MKSRKTSIKSYSSQVLERRQIYIVDDDQSACLMLKIFLTRNEFKVNTFSSAERFFSAIPNSSPGCLILDFEMPELNGWEAHQHLLKSGSKRPVIIMAEDEDDDVKEKFIQAGVTGFFQKSTLKHEIVSLINQAYIS